MKLKRMAWGPLVIALGMLLVGAGVWAHWGWPLAAMVEGVLMITIAVLAMPSDQNPRQERP